MKRYRGLGLLVLTFGLTGCAPDGPREFYRSALAARGELVDSLSSIVDDASAKKVNDTAFKLHDERIKAVQEEILKIKTRVQGAFRKLHREDFRPSMIEADDRAAMIDGMRAYAMYCKNVVYTNTRLARELDRLGMLIKLEMAAKARDQMVANQPVSVGEGDAPNLSSVIKQFDKKDDARMIFVVQGTTKESIKRLDAGLSEEELKLIFDFDLSDLTVPAPGLTAPSLPSYPAWAIEVDKRVNLGLANRPNKKAPKAPPPG